MQRQEQDRWCWAATAVSMTLFYTPSSSETQCGLAKALLDKVSCCGSGGPTVCNTKANLENALARTGVLDHPPDAGGVDITVIRNEIDNARVLCWRFQWAGGTAAHFGAIADYADGAIPQIRVFDPWLGVTWARLQDFNAGVYVDKDQLVRSGQWTDTYFTRKP